MKPVRSRTTSWRQSWIFATELSRFSVESTLWVCGRAGPRVWTDWRVVLAAKRQSSWGSFWFVWILDPNSTRESDILAHVETTADWSWALKILRKFSSKNFLTAKAPPPDFWPISEFLACRSTGSWWKLRMSILNHKYNKFCLDAVRLPFDVNQRDVNTTEIYDNSFETQCQDQSVWVERLELVKNSENSPKNLENLMSMRWVCCLQGSPRIEKWRGRTEKWRGTRRCPDRTLHAGEGSECPKWTEIFDTQRVSRKNSTRGGAPFAWNKRRHTLVAAFVGEAMSSMRKRGRFIQMQATLCLLQLWNFSVRQATKTNRHTGTVISSHWRQTPVLQVLN